MLKFLGFGLIFLAFIMLLPANSNVQSDSLKMYGIATLVLRDSTGEMLFENVIHNLVVDSGTAYMLEQTFGDGSTEVSDADQVDTVCVTDALTPDGATDDAETADDFNTENNLTPDNCIGNISFILLPNSATTGALTFEAGTHFPDGTEIGGIGVCGNGAQGLLPDGCDTTAGQAPLLAVVDTTDVTVNSGETVDITYTLELNG
ncbi:MAG TPA: hypothetical protein VJJ25_03535 [Nitrosopumilaceae archaeon]|nr:hypothetical protein [Nitrosopumilaceae archaeon]